MAQIRLDNGSNFVAAKKELQEALASLHHDHIKRASFERRRKRSFNPSTVSHCGGAWERIIRMTKKILYFVLCKKTLDNKGFFTVLCETEAEE